MTVSNKRKPIVSDYYLENEKLTKEKKIKYLGVIVDHKLTFKDHINEKCKNTTTILNMLRRNLFFTPASVKSKAYKACVLSIVEYASICWSPSSEKLNRAIEMVQHKAAKFLVNAYNRKGKFKKFSISKLLNDLNLETLEERRIQARLTMVYKILNGEVILESSLLPKYRNERPIRNCNEPTVGYENQLVESYAKIQVAESTFFYSAPILWNDRVTKKQAKAPSADAFINHFSR